MIEAADLCQHPFRAVAGTGASELEIKRSRFIGAVARAATDQVVFTLQATPAELDDLSAWLAAITNGAATPTIPRETFVDVPLSPIGDR